MVECMQPFTVFPELAVTFTSAQQNYHHVVPLPISMLHFMNPVVFPQPDFLSRWERLGTKLESVKTVTLPAATR